MGNARFIWNYFLALNKTYYNEHKLICWYNKSKDESKPYWRGMSSLLTDLKKEHTWLNEGDSQSLQNICRRLDTALKRCLVKQISEFPTFKSKHNPDKISLEINQVNGHIAVEENQIKIPKMGYVKAKIHRQMKGRLKSITIKRDNKHWIVSALFDEVREKPVFDVDNSVGIDLGLKDFLTTSDGEVIKTPKIYRKAQARLRRAQRSLARKKKGSNNRTKQRNKVARIHQKIRFKRKDFLHKLSNAIAKQYNVVFMEDLNLEEMKQEYGKSVSDQGLGHFVQMMKYKTNVVQIDRWAASTKTCSKCGHKKPHMDISERVFCCEGCGFVGDRDLNAAINIKQMGLKDIGQGLPEYTPVETGTIAPSMKQEAAPL